MSAEAEEMSVDPKAAAKAEEEIAMLEFGDLLGIGMTLVVLVIGLGYGADITADVQADGVTNVASCGLNSTGGTGGTIEYTNCGYLYNITGFGLQGLSKLSVKLPTLVGVMVAAVIIGVLVRHLYIRYAA